MKALKYITLLMFVFLFVACSEESPFEVAEEDLNEAEALAEQKYNERKSAENSVSEQEKCRRGTSTYSDDYCCTYYGERCYYYSSSSYMSDADKCYYGTGDYSADYCCTYYGYQCAYVYGSSSSRYSSSSYYSSSSSTAYYLTSTKTMKITLTFYKQVSSNWDALDNAGDPRVSFNIYTYSDGYAAQTISTETFLSKDNTRSWNGSISKTVTINKGVDQIKVCPKVIESDDVSSSDDYTSGNCETVFNVGYLKSTDVEEQSDYNKNYDLEWEWYLY